MLASHQQEHYLNDDNKTIDDTKHWTDMELEIGAPFEVSNKSECSSNDSQEETIITVAQLYNNVNASGISKK